MPDILVVYASTHGHTAKIAGRIADTLRADSADVALVPASDAPAPAGFDAVVVASIHTGHHQHEMVDWSRSHRTSLGCVPSAFFTVAGATSTTAAHGRAQPAASSVTPARSIRSAASTPKR